MPSFSYLRPTMKPVMFCKNTKRDLALAAQLDEVRAFQGRLAENKMPLLAMMPTGMPFDARKAT